MRIVIFGATGMVGQGAVRAALAADDVEEVLVVVRRATGLSDPRLREVIRADFTDFGDLAPELARCDACFYCLGVSSVRLDEAKYAAITRDMTLAAARVMAGANPAMTFVFVSGAGAELNSKTMWRRVKAEAEQGVRALPFRAVYVLRPGAIQPLDGIRSGVGWYNTMYVLARPVFALLGAVAPGSVNTTATMGRAMLRLAREGADEPVLDGRAINRLGA